MANSLAQVEKLLAANSGQVAAVIAEPLVQGAAGIIVHPQGFLKGLRELTKKYDVLLIADEVATGFGRTGTMFACEQEGVEPDLMCVAKGLTGGYLPLAATLAREKVFEAFLREPWIDTTFYHGHTYTGNALGCAAALASLEVFGQEDTLGQLPGKIELIRRYLAEMAGLDYVGDVRQRGMMAGIELVADKESRREFEPELRVGARLCQAMRGKGVILRPLGNVLVIMPPLGIRMEPLEKLLAIIAESVKRELPEMVTRL